MRLLLISVLGMTAIALLIFFWPSQDVVPSLGPERAQHTTEETTEISGPPRRAVIDRNSKPTETQQEQSPAAFRLEGRVVDAFGHGIDNCAVLVELRPVHVTVREAEPNALGEARTDSYGYFWLQFRGLEQSRIGPLVVSLDAARFPPTVARTDVEIARGRPVDLGELVLSSERGITVRTMSTTGSAIPGARLTLAPMLDDPLLSSGALDRTRRAAISDSDGLAQFYGVPPGIYRIRAEAGSYATREVTHHQTAAFRPSPLQIDLRPGAIQRGRILTADGHAVPDASIFVEAMDGGPQTKTQTDSEGHFRLTGLIANRYTLEVQSPSFGEIRRDDLELPGPALVLRLPAGAVLAGLVVDPTGRPLEGAKLSARAASGWTIIRGGEKLTLSTTTDADGLFRIPNMPAGRFELSVSSQGRAPSLHGPFEAGDLNIKITLKPSIVIHGKIIDQHGNGIAGRIEVMNPNYDGSAFAEFARLAVASGTEAKAGAGKQPLRFEAEGFALTVQPGAFRLRVSPVDSRYASFVSRTFDAQRDRVFPHLKLRAPVASIFRGQAHRGQEGSPVAAGVTVHLDPIGDPKTGTQRIGQRTQSDAKGGFSFSGVASGRYELFYNTRDRQSAAEAAATRSRTLESITLDAGASSQGTNLHHLYQR